MDFQNEVVFNGVPIAFVEFQGHQYCINPPFDSVKEFTVLQGAFSAQYGLGQGVAQYQFQSGTNKIHGNTFAVYRDAFFDAPGAVNDVKPKPRGIIGAPNSDHEIDWGFAVGGPLWIPKLYDGHGKTFWFASFEKFREASGQTPVTVPTQFRPLLSNSHTICSISAGVRRLFPTTPCSSDMEFTSTQNSRAA